MSPEAQRIAIAEACGWKNVRQLNHSFDVFADNPKHPPHASPRVPVPHYLSDLNAMHEAEKVLRRDQHTDYCNLFHDMVTRTENLGRFGYIHATPAQRAEAFLRTIGKWEES